MFFLLVLLFLPLSILSLSWEEVILLLFSCPKRTSTWHVPLFPLLLEDLEETPCAAAFLVARLMCLFCSSSSFRDKVWEYLNPIKNQCILTYYWNYCPSGCFWSSREGSGLIAEKGKVTWCLQMVVLQGMHGAGPERETSATFIREYPNAWSCSGKVGLPWVHNRLCCALLLGAFWKSKSLVPGWEKLSVDLNPTDQGGIA